MGRKITEVCLSRDLSVISGNIINRGSQKLKYLFCCYSVLRAVLEFRYSPAERRSRIREYCSTVHRVREKPTSIIMIILIDISLLTVTYKICAIEKVRSVIIKICQVIAAESASYSFVTLHLPGSKFQPISPLIQFSCVFSFNYYPYLKLRPAQSDVLNGRE